MTTFTTEDREKASKCNPHPNAPHGFLRQASHDAGRYVCECEWWSEKDYEVTTLQEANEFDKKRNYTYTLSTAVYSEGKRMNLNDIIIELHNIARKQRADAARLRAIAHELTEIVKGERNESN